MNAPNRLLPIYTTPRTHYFEHMICQRKIRLSERNIAYGTILTSRSNRRIRGHNANNPKINSPIDAKVKLHTKIL